MHKRSMALTTNMLYAVFLVIFTFILLISILSNKKGVAEQELHFSPYAEIYSVSETLFGKCLAAGSDIPGSDLINIQGLLSPALLSAYAGLPGDVRCASSERFLYKVHVHEVVGSSWEFGHAPVRSDRQISIPVHLSLYNGPSDIRPVTAELTAYFSDEIDFYGTIKRACRYRKSFEEHMLLTGTISYDGDLFCISQDCFKAAFSCPVSPFTLEEGDHLLLISYEGGVVIR